MSGGEIYVVHQEIEYHFAVIAIRYSWTEVVDLHSILDDPHVDPRSTRWLIRLSKHEIHNSSAARAFASSNTREGF